VLFSMFILGNGQTGEEDTNAPIKIALHKSFSDGYLINSIYGVRTIVDNSIEVMPFINSFVDTFDAIVFDRKNPDDKKNVI